ncbi:cyd operon protein YbgE [Thaumasiovibrio subtropicus]|uniref:cyd operon protein YbgE n=1 Tax=Thaumasiovibrio subtropicus TaxID=1891207 RepID=UPI000B34D951|nr:cyd operon protein YbgE [Thaumasiovibrio subtropicus]
MTLDQRLTRWHQPLNHGALRAVVLLMGLALVGVVMWEPTVFAEAIGGFNIVKGPLLIWSMCSAMVYGVGFNPYRWYWQLLFTPYICMVLLVGFWGLYLF